MNIITVSGEMGSLRDELASEICRRGTMELVDKQTLNEAVQGLVDISRDEHQLLAEQGPALLDLSPRRRKVFTAFLELVVLQFARRGGAVLVGRGANFLLRYVPGVLRVRTVAPLEIRAMRMTNQEGLDVDRARRLATVVDQQRRAYVAHMFGADWASPLNYDLVLNTGRLTLEQGAITVLDLSTHEEYQPTQDTDRILNDMVLAGRVRCALVEKLEMHALEVECLEGKVLLGGHVNSSKDQKAAQEIAKQVQGVSAVASKLEVSPGLSRIMA
jgi:cytidylate kinase